MHVAFILPVFKAVNFPSTYASSTSKTLITILTACVGIPSSSSLHVGSKHESLPRWSNDGASFPLRRKANAVPASSATAQTELDQKV